MQTKGVTKRLRREKESVVWFSLRMPEELMNKVVNLAGKERRHVNQQIVYLVEKALEN